MRLLNSRTLELVEFFDADRPPYAILSHRWEGKETTLQEFEAEKYLPDPEPDTDEFDPINDDDNDDDNDYDDENNDNKYGYTSIPSIQYRRRNRRRRRFCSPGTAKIRRFCRFCAEQGAGGYDWCWVDTCCIDKTSSAELTEAINSMYRWYRDAEVCYVYMNDVSRTPGRQHVYSIGGGRGEGGGGGGGGGEKQKYQAAASSSLSSSPKSLTSSSLLLKPSEGPLDAALRQSSWFTRGWTLQELLSPRFLYFLASDWTNIGSRDQLGALVSEITAVDTRCFGNPLEIAGRCVAERMSWMAGRATSRAEDVAYCLLGIFGVYMPLIYGEGDNAFARLQQEIIRSVDDETIFAWVAADRKTSGVLARSPRDFARPPGGVVRRAHWINRLPYQLTNKGLEFEIFDFPPYPNVPERVVPLNCTVEHENGKKGWVLIYLRPNRDLSWRRESCDVSHWTDRLLGSPEFPTDSQQRFKIYIRQNLDMGMV